MSIKSLLAKFFGRKAKEDKSYDRDLLQGMSKPARKDFLSNDLIERMIRVEQRVSAHFGTFLKYYQTDYYKSLSPHEKDNFKRYLDNKQKWKMLVSLALAIPILVLGLLNISFTGNVVKDNFGEFVFIDYLLMAFVFGFAVYFVISKIRKNCRRRRFNEHFKILADVLGRKYLNKG